MGLTAEPCGSRVTCNPPPTDTDADYRIQYERHDHDALVALLKDCGFEPDGGKHYADSLSNFHSWRSGEINLLISSNPEWIRRHRLATWLCKSINIMDKQLRIALFQRILYREEYAENNEDIPF